MKYTFFIITALLSFTIISCEDDEKQRIAETRKAEQRNDSILKVVSSNWKFDVPPPTQKVKERIKDWNEWERFMHELSQKPTGTLTAYRQKAENLINKVTEVQTTIPPLFNKPQVRGRLAVLDTKVKSLYTYITLDIVQCDKVLPLIDEITEETIALQKQFDEIVRISEIPKEMGEEEMLRARDTARMANPENIPQPSITPPVKDAPPASTDVPNRQRQPIKTNKLKPAN
ncbi:hypothetical protein E0W68_13025 [Flavobacterium salilacus subsp. salilacus]|uniref:hypothetical protein n=1 Tax=Flavobacterium TaxID=237 RepID=UPI001074B2A0|nr:MULTISPECIES: hypothetical protein [Flavobacterium]KAF2515453.1 hypothetical protein E0W68_13025 [Flavobacterium salilacus subsp. salilacus]MBE1615850.1 hypothetical protein [Flavobacterium sp. SaA2.13]